MAKKIYIGNASVARNVKSMYVGVNGVARKVKKGYIGVNGIARQFYSSGIDLNTATWTYTHDAFMLSDQYMSWGMLPYNADRGGFLMYASSINGTSVGSAMRKSADGVEWESGTMLHVSGSSYVGNQSWNPPAWINNRWFRYSDFIPYDYFAYRATSTNFLSWTGTDNGNIYVDGRQSQNIESLACSESYAVGWCRTTGGYYYLLRSSTPWSGFGSESLLISDTNLDLIDNMNNISEFKYNKSNNTFYVACTQYGSLYIFRSTNNGATWSYNTFDCDEYGLPLTTPMIIICNSVNVMYLKFGYGDSCKIFVSFDGLATIQQVSITGDTEFGMVDYVMGTYISINTDYRNLTWYPRVYWSSDGINFKMKELSQFTGLSIGSFASDGTKIIFSTSGNQYSTIAKTNGYITCTP